jgi:hypothetical protein
VTKCQSEWLPGWLFTRTVECLNKSVTELAGQCRCFNETSQCVPQASEKFFWRHILCWDWDVLIFLSPRCKRRASQTTISTFLTSFDWLFTNILSFVVKVWFEIRVILLSYKSSDINWQALSFGLDTSRRNKARQKHITITGNNTIRTKALTADHISAESSPAGQTVFLTPWEPKTITVFTHGLTLDTVQSQLNPFHASKFYLFRTKFNTTHPSKVKSAKAFLLSSFPAVILHTFVMFPFWCVSYQHCSWLNSLPVKNNYLREQWTVVTMQLLGT